MPASRMLPALLASALLTFPVIAGTALFVPLFFFDDSPPVVGTWPTDPSQYANYVFGPDDFNAQGIEIVVDGKVTPVGAQFLGAAVQTNPLLLDGGGSHILQLGVFLKPLSIGTHTVTVKGEVGDTAAFIQAAASVFGDCLQSDFTYAVRVFPPFEE